MKRLAFACLVFGTSLAFAAITGAVDASSHTRNYGFSFERGNHIPNWSFENEQDGWFLTDASTSAQNSVRLHQSAPELKALKLIPPSGSYVAVADLLGTTSKIISDPVPIQGGATYTLSFWYAAPALTGPSSVMITWSSSVDLNWVSSISAGDKYQTVAISKVMTKVGSWNLFKAQISAPSWATHISVGLGAASGAGSSGKIYFDDVILESGTKSASRANIGESIQLADSKGRSVQSLARLTHGAGAMPPAECLEDFPYFASETFEVRNQVSIPGDVKAGKSIIFQSTVKALGNLESDGSVELYSQAAVTGNVAFGTTLYKQDQSVVLQRGSIQKSPQPCLLPPIEVAPGSLDIHVPNSSTVTLTPGKYQNIYLGNNGSKVLLQSGEYDIRSITTEPDAQLLIDAQDGPVILRIASEINFADRTKMILQSGAITNLVQINYAGTNDLNLGNDMVLFGQIYAPNARVNVKARGRIEAQIWAKNVYVDAVGVLVIPEFFGLVGGPSKWSVSEGTVDVYGRPDKSYLPIVAKLDFGAQVLNYDSLSKAYNNGTNAPDAGARPFAAMSYSLTGVVGNTPPGDQWVAAGSTAGEQFVADLLIPAHIDTQFGTGTSNLNNAPYSLSWSHGTENRYSLTWKNREGQVVKTATNSSYNGNTPMSQWDWAITTYDYYPDGSLRGSTSPTQTGTARLHDSQGRPAQIWDADRGATRAWYDQNGALKVTQDASQQVNNSAVLTETDWKGRFVRECLVTGNNTTLNSDYMQFLADYPEFTCNPPADEFYTSIELRGVQYDNTTNLNLPPGVKLENIQNNVVAKWRTNNDIAVPRIVDGRIYDLYSYDRKGRVTRTYRYIPGMPGLLNLTYVEYTYDDTTHRVTREDYSRLNNSTSTLLEARVYSYDQYGRVKRIADQNGATLTTYSWDERGSITQAHLGSQVNIATQWGLKGLDQNTATQGSNLLYSETLVRGSLTADQDGIATPAGPGTMDGRVTREIRQRRDSTDLLDYAWDQSGRMQTSAKYTRIGQAPWRPTSNEQWTYTQDGSVSTRNRDSKLTTWNYIPGTHMLDHVDSLHNNNSTSATPGTFLYDESGRMIVEWWRGFIYDHGADGRVTGVYDERTQNPDSVSHYATTIHDFDGWSVGTITTTGMQYTQLKADWTIEIAGRRRAEVHQDLTTDPVQVTTLLQGMGGAVGRRHPDGSKEWYVKDWRGSTVKTVHTDVSGNVQSNGWEFTYGTYGYKTNLRVDNASNIPGQQWEGKTQDDRTGQTTIGVRLWDPELAIWLTPDPAAQYNDPYGTSGDLVNSYDPNGLWEVGLGITFGYTHKGGFRIGVGSKFDLGSSMSYGASWGYNQRSDSWSGGASAYVAAPLPGGYLYAGGSANYDTKSGTALNGYAGVWALGVGGEVGGGLYWDHDNDFRGTTRYVKGYVGTQAANVGGGYEWGTGDMQGRGWFEEANLGPVTGSHAQHGGWDWGASGYVASYTITNKKPMQLLTNRGGPNDKIGHSAIDNADGVSTVSWGPKVRGFPALFLTGGKEWSDYDNEHGTEETPIYGGSANIEAYGEYLSSSIMPYSLIFSSCSEQVGYAMLSTGRFLPGMIHPYLLQMNMQLHRGYYVGE